jgi:phospholipid/cholesterol/gamma-HCH transport system substrate-binding protein
MKPLAAFWRLAVAGVIAIVLFILLANALKQPVAGTVRSYTAEFTDSSGLYPGADVRVRGVRVGKVQSVELQRHDGRSVSAVGFTLIRRYGVVPDTRLAIKYQSLTGSRYIDVRNASENDSNAHVVARIPTAMTQPSFDITALFNGLQPVLTTLNPDEINSFAQNAADFLSGNAGLAPMLKSIQSLTRFMSNRQQIVSTLMSNLSIVANAMGGHSKDMIQLLDYINRPLNGALSVLDQFRMTELYSTGFLFPVQQLLINAGFPSEGNSGVRLIREPPGHQDLNATNIDDALDRAFNNVDVFINSMKLVPVMWDNVGPPAQAGAPAACSKGRFQLPEQMDVLLNGQRVVLCNP